MTYSEAMLIALSDRFIGFGEVVVNVRFLLEGEWKI
jgi:hypothetical protein